MEYQQPQIAASGARAARLDVVELQERLLQVTERMVQLLTESLSPFGASCGGVHFEPPDAGAGPSRAGDVAAGPAAVQPPFGPLAAACRPLTAPGLGAGPAPVGAGQPGSGGDGAEQGSGGGNGEQSSSPADAADEATALGSEQRSIFKEFHRTLQEVEEAGLLERLLEADAQRAMAPIAVPFLLDVALACRGGLRQRAVEDLRLVLRAPSWKEVLLTKDSLHRQLEGMPAECAYLLRGLRVEPGAGAGEGQPGAVAPSTPLPPADAESAEAPMAPQALKGSEEESFWSFVEVDKAHSQQIQKNFKESVDRARESIRQKGARVVIMGNSGAGKSSCINAAFHAKVAETGAGISVTSHIAHYEPSDLCPIHIYDTKGFEGVSDNRDVLQQLRALVEERKQASAEHAVGQPGRVTERLHVVWYVIDGRFEPEFMGLVESIFAEQDVPVIVVLNKCDLVAHKVQEVRDSVERHCPWAAAVVEVVADPLCGPARLLCHNCGSDDIMINAKKEKRYFSCDECGPSKQRFKRCYGFDTLIRETADRLPDLVVLSLLTAQREWLEGLHRSANMKIAGYTCAAAGVGAAPLPFMSRFVLIPLQLAMVGTLALNYDLLVTSKTAWHIIFSVSSVGLFGALGCLAANGLKAVPGFAVAGMVSDAAFSATVTGALGAVTKLMFTRVRGKALAGEVSPEDIDSVMDREEQQRKFREYFDRLTEPIREIVTDVRNCSVEHFEEVLAMAG